MGWAVGSPKRGPRDHFPTKKNHGLNSIEYAILISNCTMERLCTVQNLESLTSDCDSKMDAKQTCETLISNLKWTNLKYHLEETPFSVHIHIRKSFVKGKIVKSYTLSIIWKNLQIKMILKLNLKIAIPRMKS